MELGRFWLRAPFVILAGRKIPPPRFQPETLGHLNIRRHGDGMSQTDSLRAESAAQAGAGREDYSSEAVSIYDRFTSLYNLMFRINRYRQSVERYFRQNPLPLPDGARILDAGCGTGLLTLALLRALERPAHIAAADLSLASLKTARRAARKESSRTEHTARFARANALKLPFGDDSFDLVVTSGVLEYLPLDEGMSEMARVLRPGGYFFYLPVRPSPMTRLLELMFRFKAHNPRAVIDTTTRRFQLIHQHYFSFHEPIGWSKTAILAQKQEQSGV
jgi:ubiquinone/menaquinone biosynthesis C-methylase UbiE